jgi:hypothetical protein
LVSIVATWPDVDAAVGAEVPVIVGGVAFMRRLRRSGRLSGCRR